MSLILTVLLSLLSAGLLAGRVYEILVLTDAQTGFLLVGGIVFNPYVLAVFAVIAVCCGILIFGSINTAKPYYSKASRYTAALAGVALVAAGALSLSTDKVSMFIIAGGLALLVIAFAGLGKKNTDYLAIVLLLVFTAGLCMDVIAFDVYTIYNTAFMQKALAYITAIAFMLYVLKNVYIPSSTSRMMLYILGMLAFAFCSMMSLADIISFVVQNGGFDVELVNDIAFVLFGLYAFDNAISVVPTKKEIKTAKAVQNMPVLLNPDVENNETEEKAENAEPVLEIAEETEQHTAEDGAETADTITETETEQTEHTEAAEYELTEEATEEVTDITDVPQTEVQSEEQVEETAEISETAETSEEPNAENSAEDYQNEISEQDSLAKMFEDFAAEKAQRSEMEKEDLSLFVQQETAIDEQQNDASRQEMLKTLFDIQIAEEQPAEKEAPKVRSFKKVIAPKHDEAAAQYDMLKSMFKGEDTSDYQVEIPQQEKETAVLKEDKQKKKFSFFGAEKAEKPAKKKTVEKAAEKPVKKTEKKSIPQQKSDSKVKFTASEPRVSKTKGETKKIVYKKPK